MGSIKSFIAGILACCLLCHAGDFPAQTAEATHFPAPTAAVMEREALIESVSSAWHPMAAQVGARIRRWTANRDFGSAFAVLVTAASIAHALIMLWHGQTHVGPALAGLPISTFFRPILWQHDHPQHAAPVYGAATQDHTSLADDLEEMMKDDRWIAQLTEANFSLNALEEWHEERYLRHDSMRDITTRYRMNDNETSLPIFVETMEDELLGTQRQRGNVVDLVAVTVPTATTNKLQDRYGIPGLTDAFKRYLHESIVSNSIEASMSGGTLYLKGKSPRWVTKNLDKNIRWAQRRLLNDPHVKALIGDKRAEEFETDLLGLKFYASHVPLKIERDRNLTAMQPDDFIPKSAKSHGLQVLEDRIAAAEKELTDAKKGKRASLLDHLAAAQAEYRKELSRVAGYWLNQQGKHPNARAYASEIAELYIYQSLLESKARVELSEKCPPIIQKVRDSIINGTKDTPMIDEEAIRLIDATLRHRKNDAMRIAFYDQMQSGRKKLIAPYNYYTGHLPRLLHHSPEGLRDELSETYYALLKLYPDADDKAALIAEFQAAYFAYRYATYRDLVLSTRDPRLEDIIKLDAIDSVVEADQRGLWTALGRHLDALYPSQTEELQKLIIPGLFFFKRSIGDEIGCVVVDAAGKYRMAFGELTKANAYQQKYGDPSDLRDSTFHKIFLELRDVTKESIGAKEPLADALPKWKDAVERIAPEPLQSNDKVAQRNGNVIRPAGYYVKGGDPRVMTHLMTEGRRKIYEKNVKDKWELTTTVQPEDLEPFETRLGIATLFQEKPVVPGEIASLFDTFDRLVVNQKKNDNLKSQVVAVNRIAVKVLLPQLNYSYWLESVAGKAADIVIKLREIVPDPAPLGIYNGARLKKDVYLGRLNKTAIGDTGYFHEQLFRIKRNSLVFLGETIVVFFNLHQAARDHASRTAA